MKDNFKKQLWIGASIILGSIVIASLGLFLLSNNVVAVSSSIALARSAVFTQANTIATFSSLKGSASAAAEDQVAMDKLLTTQDKLIVFPAQIDALGRADGVSTDFSFSAASVASTQNAAGTVGFTMDATGPLANLVAFLQDFEVNDPILLSNITTFTMTGDGTNYTFSAQGTVFFK